MLPKNKMELRLRGKCEDCKITTGVPSRGQQIILELYKGWQTSDTIAKSLGKTVKGRYGEKVPKACAPQFVSRWLHEFERHDLLVQEKKPKHIDSLTGGYTRITKFYHLDIRNFLTSVFDLPPPLISILTLYFQDDIVQKSCLDTNLVRWMRETVFAAYKFSDTKFSVQPPSEDYKSIMKDPDKYDLFFINPDSKDKLFVRKALLVCELSRLEYIRHFEKQFKDEKEILISSDWFHVLDMVPVLNGI